MKQQPARSRLTPFVLGLGCLMALGLGATSAEATSYIMVSDETLVDQAPVVVEARVVSRDNAPVAGTPSTDYLIEVERLVKGSVPGSNLVVRVSGGVGSDGIGLKVWGAPIFEPGEQVLLFLRPRADGTFRILHLMLGAFHRVSVGGEPILVRNLAEATEVARPGEPESIAARFRRPRRQVEFIDWIADRGRGVESEAGYFAELGEQEIVSTSAGFTLFQHQGLNLRWFSFDTGAFERWQVHSGGQAGLSIGQAINALINGMNAWNSDVGSDINYGIDSPQTTTASGGLTNYDAVNVLLFENPNNNPDFEDDFSCGSGGVLAIGGPWFQNAPQNGFKPIIGGDIITNRGLECYFQAQSNPQKTAEQLFGHELGHTLGIGHSCGDSSSPSCGSSAVLNDALMRASIHNDNRGARLNSDDLAAARTLYGNGNAPGNGPNPPSDLTAALIEPLLARLGWSDNSNDESAFQVQQRIGAGSFVNLANTAANATTLDVVLLPQTTYTWRVRALGASGNSGYSNQASLTTPAAAPVAPGDLIATAVSGSVVLLDWEDRSINEIGFAVEMSSPVQSFTQIGVTGPDADSFPVGGLVEGRPYTFRVRALNGSGSSAPSNEASATPLASTTDPCVAADNTLCLLGGRFQVDVVWRNQFNAGDNGPGVVQPSPVGGDRIGVFSFFNPSNIELIVKALDGRVVNGNYWFFYGALSTVEYWITVVDTETGEANTYHNPPDELCGFPDTDAFAGSATAGLAADTSARMPLRAVRIPAAATAGWMESFTSVSAAGSAPCAADATTLCLLDDRFEVTVDWTDQRTLDSGEGKAIVGSNKSGYFWFFNADNVELVVKILDARPIDGSFWVFYGALSDVEYTITVFDTVTENGKSYVNPPGEFCGRADTDGLSE